MANKKFSNVGELDDISRLREKEGYPESAVKLDSADEAGEGVSRSRQLSRSRPSISFNSKWLKTAVLIIAVLTLSVAAVVYLPRLRVDLEHAGFSYAGEAPDANSVVKTGGSIFSLYPNMGWELEEGIIYFYPRLIRRSRGATVLLVSADNIGQLNVSLGNEQCPRLGEVFECMIDAEETDAQLSINGYASEDVVRIHLFGRACDGCDPSRISSVEYNVTGMIQGGDE